MFPLLLFYFIFGHAECGILVSQPGIEPLPLVVKAQSLNHWTTREVPKLKSIICFVFVQISSLTCSNKMCWSLALSPLLLLLSRFSCVQLCATLQTAAHQAPMSLGFSRQDYWSRLPFPSPMHESEK